MKTKHQIKTQRETSVRPDGKLSVWERFRGKFDWTCWILVDVQENKQCKPEKN